MPDDLFRPLRVGTLLRRGLSPPKIDTFGLFSPLQRRDTSINYGFAIGFVRINSKGDVIVPVDLWDSVTNIRQIGTVANGLLIQTMIKMLIQIQ